MPTKYRKEHKCLSNLRLLRSPPSPSQPRAATLGRYHRLFLSILTIDLFAPGVSISVPTGFTTAATGSYAGSAGKLVGRLFQQERRFAQPDLVRPRSSFRARIDMLLGS